MERTDTLTLSVVLTDTQLHNYVQAGIATLTDTQVADIDTDTLDLSDDILCIVGQVHKRPLFDYLLSIGQWSTYAEQHGYFLKAARSPIDYDRLTAVWLTAISERLGEV